MFQGKHLLHWTGPLRSPERSRFASGPHAALHHQCPLHSPKRSRCQYSKASASTALATGNDFAMSGDHHLQERRVSARRDSVNRALCRRSRDLFGGDRSDNQERRASARRGWIKPASAETVRHSSADRRRCVCADHRCGRVYKRHGANVATESFMAHTAPDYNHVHWCHGGRHAPRSCVAVNRTSVRRNNDLLRRTNVHSNKSGGRQPAVVRRTERCAVATALCSTTTGPTTKSGGREPAVVRRTERCAVATALCSATTGATTKSGGRQPAVGG
jgi:hypothetical protein